MTATCSVFLCDRPARSRGMCDSHYRRWVRTGKTPEGPIDLTFRGRYNSALPRDEIVRLANDELLIVPAIAARLRLTPEQVRYVLNECGVDQAANAAERRAREAAEKKAARIAAADPCVICSGPCLCGPGGVCSDACRDERDRRMVEAARAGESYSAIAARFGLNPNYIASLARSAGVRRKSTTTDEEQAEIIRVFEAGRSIAVCARLTGRSEPTVRRVLVLAGRVPPKYAHGTVAAYNLDGCHCRDCTEANTRSLAQGRQSERRRRAALAREMGRA